MEKKILIKYILIASFFVFNGIFFTSCKDDYKLDDEEPPRDILAPSIYYYLEEKGTFKNFLRLADEIEVQGGGKYSEVLKKTGSKTAFVADDAAFERFYNSNNDWGVSKFEDFSDAQRRMVLFSAMIDDAYSLAQLSSSPGAGGATVEGEVMRKAVSLNVLDSVPYEGGSNIPSKNKYWERFKGEVHTGIHVLKDNSVPSIVYFLPAFLKSKNITDTDFKYISQKSRTEDEAFVYNLRVSSADNFCKNGYVNIMEELLIPQDNMAEFLRKNENTQLFSSFIERFSAPYYDHSLTLAYRNLHPEFTDSIFVKRFFTQDGTEETLDPFGNKIVSFLSFDPGKNNYRAGTKSMQADMGVMFIPTDDVLNAYFNEGEGAFLKRRYGSWENVPDNVLLNLVNNHMKPSFLAALPSQFNELADKMGNPMGVDPSHITGTKICSNGVLYMVDKVYPPTEYIAVTAPVSLSENTRIMDWAINKLEFDLYLLSMEREEDERGELVISNPFSLFIPTDDVLNNYTDPVSLGKNTNEKWKFFYNESTSAVNAVVYSGVEPYDSLRTITAEDAIKNRLLDILDNHIVVGPLDANTKYYRTKGNATLKINYAGPAGATKVQGGSNIEENVVADVTEEFDMLGTGNGITYFVNKVLDPPLKTIEQIMEDRNKYPEFGSFFDLCIAAKEYEVEGEKFAGSIFSIDNKFPGIGQSVTFFNTYHYTIYIPTNEAIAKAKQQGLIKDWDEIDAMIATKDQQGKEAQKLYDFLRYHFQDNSVYYSNYTSKEFETAALNKDIRKFRKVRVVHDAAGFRLYSEGNEEFSKENPDPAKSSAEVKGIYNIMARDVKFNEQKTRIETSSFAVIHQIDKVLDFNK